MNAMNSMNAVKEIREKEIANCLYNCTELLWSIIYVGRLSLSDICKLLSLNRAHRRWLNNVSVIGLCPFCRKFIIKLNNCGIDNSFNLTYCECCYNPIDNYLKPLGVDNNTGKINKMIANQKPLLNFGYENTGIVKFYGNILVKELDVLKINEFCRYTQQLRTMKITGLTFYIEISIPRERNCRYCKKNYIINKPTILDICYNYCNECIEKMNNFLEICSKIFIDKCSICSKKDVLNKNGNCYECELTKYKKNN